MGAVKETGKAVLQIAGPVFAEETYLAMLGVSMTAILTNIGSNVLAAFSLTTAVFSTFILICSTVGTGSAIIIAKTAGRSRSTLTKEIVGQTLLLAILGGIALGAVCYIIADFIFYWTDTDNDTALLANSLLKSWSYFSPFVLVLSTGKALLQGMGDTSNAFLLSSSTNTFSLLAGYFLLFFLQPAAGAAGLVWGAGIAAISGSLLCLTMLKNHSRLNFALHDVLVIKPRVLQRMLQISLPISLEQISLQTGFTVFAFFTVTANEKQFAGLQIAQQLECLPLIVGSGLSVAVMSIVARSLGNNNPRLAMHYTRYIAITNLFSMTILCAIACLACETVIPHFTSDGEIVQWAARCISLTLLEQPVMAVNFILASALRGAGDTRWPTISTSIGMWTVRIPLTYLLLTVYHCNITVVLIITALDHVTRCLILLWRFSRLGWRFPVHLPRS